MGQRPKVVSTDKGTIKPEEKLAVQIADRFVIIHEVDDGYDYSIISMDYKEIDGGIYESTEVSILEVLNDIVCDLKSSPDYNGTKGTIQSGDNLILIDYDDLMKKVEEANLISNK